MRNTIQRQMIFDAVSSLSTHPAAEQVYEHVVTQYPSISKATVYRNLKQMSDAGELLNIGDFNGVTRYDHNCHRHYHFTCDACGQIFDVNSCLDICSKVKNMEEFEITGYSLTFNGLCKNCKL